jgi:hypothetical protein
MTGRHLQRGFLPHPSHMRYPAAGGAGRGRSSSRAVLLLRRDRDTVDYVLSVVTEHFLSHLQPRPDENEIFAVWTS